MKLPNWFKILWWVLSLIIVGFLFIIQFDLIKEGKSTNIDIFIFLIFVSLLLLPLFSEFEFFGIKLKKDIEELKKDIDIKFGEIKNDINNTQTITTNISGFGPPPSDNKIKELENKIDEIIQKQSQDSQDNTPEQQVIHTSIFAPENNVMMFKIRFNIENEIRRIWKQHFTEKDSQYKPILKLMNDLTKYEIINRDLYGILREILSICNIGIHEDSLTEEQVNFVLKHSKEIIDYLKHFNEE